MSSYSDYLTYLRNSDCKCKFQKGDAGATGPAGPAGAPGTTGAGSIYEIQYFDGTDLSASSNFLFNSSTNLLKVVGDTDLSGSLDVSNNITLFNKIIMPNNIKIGDISSGEISQGTNSISIGKKAGYNTQGDNAIAIGYQAGSANQQNSSVAIGNASGSQNQKENSVAIGLQAGQIDQSENCIAIGANAGNARQNSYSIAIGYNAGFTDLCSNTIVINAQSSALDASTNGNAFYVAPVRDVSKNASRTTNFKIMVYDSTNKEIAFDSSYNGTATVIGASTNPGGSDTQIQYNNSGSFDGTGGMTWDGTNLSLLGHAGLQDVSAQYLDLSMNLQVDGSANITGNLDVTGSATLATVDINAGAIDGTTIGANSASTGVFTNLSATGHTTLQDVSAQNLDLSMNLQVDGSANITGNLDVTGSATLATVDINAGAIDGTTIGANSASTGVFTNLSTTGHTTLQDVSAQNLDLSMNLQVDGSANITGNLDVTGSATLATVDINAGAIDGTTIGANSASTGVFTNLSTTGHTTLQDVSAQNLDLSMNLQVDGSATLATVDINAGAIDGTTIGANSASTGVFTNLSATGHTALQDVSAQNLDLSMNLQVDGSANITGNLDVTGSATLATVDINAGAIDGTTIGANSASTGVFTNLSTTGHTTLQDVSAQNLDLSMNLQVDGSANITGNLDVTGSATLATVDINAGAIDGTTIGANSASTGVFTNLSATGHTALQDVSAQNLDLSMNLQVDGSATLATVDINAGAIDGTTIGANSASTGVFTNLSATGHTALQDVSAQNLDLSMNLQVDGSANITGNLDVTGSATLATVDINAGAIDGTTIGANSASTGVFTNLSATGHTALQDVSAQNLDLSMNLQVDGTADISENLTLQNKIIMSQGVKIGDASSGEVSQNSTAIAIGQAAGWSNQSKNSIAIGLSAGYNNQDASSIAIGYKAGASQQQTYAIALGYEAGDVSQNDATIAIGAWAGQTSQLGYSIAIGTNAGKSNQEESSIAIGLAAGQTSQVGNSIALGTNAGKINQQASSIAIGFGAGGNSQATKSIAIGLSAGVTNQQTSSVAIGTTAGNSSQGNSSIAIGDVAGVSNQQNNSIAIGYGAGYKDQSNNSIAVGSRAGHSNQKDYCIAIGENAGKDSQNSYSIAIGYKAGLTDLCANTIVINAQSTTLDASTNGNAFYVAPVRDVSANSSRSNFKVMVYDSTNKEIAFDSSNNGTGGGGGGGSTNPGGSDTQLQYNSGGTDFGGTTGLTWDGTNLSLLGHAGLQDVSAQNLDLSMNLQVDGSANITGNLDVTGSATLATVDINAGAIDGTTIGANGASTGVFTNLSATGHTALQDVSAQNLDLSMNLQVDGSANITGNLDVNAGISVKNGASSGGFIDFYEDSDSGSNKIRIVAAATLADDYTLTLPTALPESDKVLQSTNAGVLSWVSNAGGGTSALNDLTDVSYNDGNLVISSLDTITYSNSATAAVLNVTAVSGTDVAGKNITISAGQSTGTGPGGSIIFQVADGGGSTGSSANPLATAVTINDDKSVLFNGTISCGAITSTGDSTMDKLTIDDIAIDGSANITGNLDVTGSATLATVDINAGAIDGTTIGANSASTGVFTNLSTTGHTTLQDVSAQNLDLSMNLQVDGSANITGNLDVTGSATLATVDINAGAIDGTTIGANSASTGVFTNLSTTGHTTLQDVSAQNLDLSMNLQVDGSANITGNLDVTGSATLATVDINAGAIDGTTIGANSASTGVFTNLSTTGHTTLQDVSAQNLDLSMNLQVDGSANITGNLTVSGTVTVSTISNPGSDVDKFLVSNSGVIGFRTGAEVASDIGASSVSLSGSTNNTICTVTGADAIQGEANLTFDSTNLSIKADSSVLKFGVDEEITLTHTADTGLTLTGPLLNGGSGTPLPTHSLLHIKQSWDGMDGFTGGPGNAISFETSTGDITPHYMSMGFSQTGSFRCMFSDVSVEDSYNSNNGILFDASGLNIISVGGGDEGTTGLKLSVSGSGFTEDSWTINIYGDTDNDLGFFYNGVNKFYMNEYGLCLIRSAGVGTGASSGGLKFYHTSFNDWLINFGSNGGLDYYYNNVSQYSMYIGGEFRIHLGGLDSGGLTLVEDGGLYDIWQITVAGSTGHEGDLGFYYDLAGIGYLRHDVYIGNITFTGQHRNLMNSNITISSIGLIVSSTGKYVNLNNSLNSNINESLPICDITSTNNDKRVFGVLSDKEDSENERNYENGVFVSVLKKQNTNEQRMFINSLGEGALWVCNKNGTIENGDYITSSTVPGYGIIQSDDLLHNYTVAKLTCDCDFSITKIVKQKLKVITTLDISGNTTTAIDYDANGNIQFEDDLDSSGNQQMVYEHDTRFLESDGTQITESQYSTKLAAGESVYIACFVGCTYHCG